MTHKGSKESRVIVETEFHGQKISFESGWLAKQAGGSVLVRSGETSILATVCSAEPREGQNFFPMVVEYQEKTYAGGRIPGGFLKREGRPGEHEILVARLTDRPIRPLFPDGYMNEVQIILNVLSSDGKTQPDVLAMCAASAALHISELPFDGPIAGVRVGRIDGQLVVNPTYQDLEKSDMDFIIAGTSDAIVMVEGGAEVVPEKDVLDALLHGHDELQKIISLQNELREKLGKEKVEFIPPEKNTELQEKVRALSEERLKAALSNHDKLERRDALKAVKTETKEALAEEYPEEGSEISEELDKTIKRISRLQIINDKVRIDGRGLADVRPIECEVEILPRTHGSALFTRGETQALVTTTLGTSTDVQRMDLLTGYHEKKFMLHYNFPPFCTGEAKMLRGTSRREVGHGNLAHRAISAVLPDLENDFPYVLRIVSEVLESNGSSSMASVCGGSLSLMQAGVPTKAPVAGVAMGLIKEGDDVAVLTDILGDEDHFGDMDFKVCGTEEGITALQMDIKCSGLSRETMEQALGQAREGRLHILGEMNKVLSKPNTELSRYSPTIETLKINPDKIRDLIGPGGKTIRSIVESTGAKIDVQDDGTVRIASPDEEAGKRAKEIVMGLTEEAEIGKIYAGVVKRIADFGAFVEILPGTEGLVHISQLDNHRVESVTDVVKEGDEVKVRVLDIDRQGRIRLSRREAFENSQA